jgi:hypothetical protein
MCPPFVRAHTQVRPYSSSRFVPKLSLRNAIFAPKLCLGTARD